MCHHQSVAILRIYRHHLFWGAWEQFFHHGTVFRRQNISCGDGFFTIIGFSGTLPGADEGFHLFKGGISEGGVLGSHESGREEETTHGICRDEYPCCCATHRFPPCLICDTVFLPASVPHTDNIELQVGLSQNFHEKRRHSPAGTPSVVFA